MDGKKIFIGRNPQCDYVIDQRYESVSGDHCSLTEEINERTGAVVCYRLDEHSTNGTHINAQLIHHSTFYVHQGDHITLGAQYVLEWDKINACFAAQSRKTMSRPYVPPTSPDPRATQRRPAPIPNQWSGDNAATVRNAAEAATVRNATDAATVRNSTDAAYNATQMVNTGETVITNNPNTIPPAKKKRNGFVTFLLWLGIIGNIVSPARTYFVYQKYKDALDPAVSVLFQNDLDSIVHSFYSDMQSCIVLITAGAVILAILNIVSYSLLLNWKKAGYYLLCGSSVLSAIVSTYGNMHITDIYARLVSDVSDGGVLLTLNSPFTTTVLIATAVLSVIIVPLIWRGILAIRKDGKSCWSQLS